MPRGAGAAARRTVRARTRPPSRGAPTRREARAARERARTGRARAGDRRRGRTRAATRADDRSGSSAAGAGGPGGRSAARPAPPGPPAARGRRRRHSARRRSARPRTTRPATPPTPAGAARPGTARRRASTGSSTHASTPIRASTARTTNPAPVAWRADPSVDGHRRGRAAVRARRRSTKPMSTRITRPGESPARAQRPGTRPSGVRRSRRGPPRPTPARASRAGRAAQPAQAAQAATPTWAPRAERRGRARLGRPPASARLAGRAARQPSGAGRAIDDAEGRRDMRGRLAPRLARRCRRRPGAPASAARWSRGRRSGSPRRRRSATSPAATPTRPRAATSTRCCRGSPRRASSGCCSSCRPSRGSSRAGPSAVLIALVPVTAFLLVVGGAGAPQAGFALAFLLGIAWLLGVAGSIIAASRRRLPRRTGGRRERRGSHAVTRASEGRHRPTSDLSSSAQEYLLTLRIMAGDGSRITASQVARKLGVSTQAASEMFRRLANDGLVSLAEGRELQLTKPGRAAADGIFRRHALCEWLLTEIVGLGWAESDVEAERLQAAISPRVEAQLDELLGHPQTCPHGNPIDAETPPAGDRRARPLAAVEPASGPRSTGSPRRPRRTRALLSYLEARGLRPGRAGDDPRAIRVARFADARRAARAGDARPSAGGARPRPARRGRSGAVPPGARPLRRRRRPFVTGRVPNTGHRRSC